MSTTNQSELKSKVLSTLKVGYTDTCLELMQQVKEGNLTEDEVMQYLYPEIDLEEESCWYEGTTKEKVEKEAKVINKMLAAQESDSESEDEEDNIVMCTLCSQKIDCNHHNIYIFSKGKEEQTLCESCCAQNKRMYKRDGWECDDFDDDEEDEEDEEDDEESLAFEKIRRDAKRPQTFTETYENESPEKRERLLILQANCKEAYEEYVAFTNADQDTGFCKDCDEPLVDGYTFNTREGSVCVDCLDNY